MKQFKLFAAIISIFVVIAMMAACAAPAVEQAAAPAAEEAAAPAAEEAAAPAEAAAAPTEESGYNYHLGLVQPGPEAYYQNYADSVKAAAEYAGMEVTALLAEYDAEKEISNVEDLISRGVDAIAVFTVASDTAQVDAQLCNEAGIPLFLMSCTASEGSGVPTCIIGNSFVDMGYQDGKWVAENLTGPQNVVIIEGALGQGIAELHTQGFEDAIKDSGRTDINIVFQQTANWVRADAISITEDVISSGKDFNLIFVHNEDMGAGVINTLVENDLIDSVNVVACNGSNDGIALIKEGKLDATCANPPSYVGGDVVVQIMKYFDGIEVGPTLDSPVFMIDANNVNDANLVTWDKVWAISRVDEYLATK